VCWWLAAGLLRSWRALLGGGGGGRGAGRACGFSVTLDTAPVTGLLLLLVHDGCFVLPLLSKGCIYADHRSQITDLPLSASSLAAS
jgi:hypothetical protein